jgi:hypothetical protein
MYGMLQITNSNSIVQLPKPVQERQQFSQLRAFNIRHTKGVHPWYVVGLHDWECSVLEGHE